MSEQQGGTAWTHRCERCGEYQRAPTSKEEAERHARIHRKARGHSVEVYEVDPDE